MFSVVLCGFVSSLASSIACAYEEGFDFSGDDIKAFPVGVVKTKEDCCAQCGTTPGCNAWTLWEAGPQCYLKKDANGRVVSSGHVSGRMPAKPASIEDATDCAMRSFFIEYASKVNSNINADRAQQMAEALSGDPSKPVDCVVKVPSIKTAKQKQPKLLHSSVSAVFFADSKNGDDSAAGTFTAPFRTVLRAVQASRASPGISTINLRAGTYYSTSLELTPADSGLTIETYHEDASNGNMAWLSGSVPLVNITWQKSTSNRMDSNSNSNSNRTNSTSNIWTADLSHIDALTHVSIRSLRLNDMRLINARYPNCNPELELCFEPAKRGAASKTTTLATKWINTASKSSAKQYTAPSGTTRQPAPPNNQPDIAYKMHYSGGNCDLLTPSISHFCGSSNVITGAMVTKDQAPNQPYANPAGALFSAMHGGSWCSFAHEVGDSPGDYSYNPTSSGVGVGAADAGVGVGARAGVGVGQFTFSGGGQQCNRQEGSHGPLIIENVFEELDSPGEFFYNTTTRVLTLWHNASAGVPPPGDGSLVVPKLTTLLAARGSQAAPVVNITLNDLGFRDTASSIMLPHTGPSGGDWSVNRNASVVLEGVANVSVARCHFHRLDNSGIFLGGFARGVAIVDNEFAWLGESGVVSVGDTDGGPVPGWGVDGSAGNQPRGTKLWYNYGRELGIINKQSALYFQAVTDGADVRGNVAFNGARSGANFNDCFGSGSHFTKNVFFNMNRETADHGTFNAWDRISFVPRKTKQNRDELSFNAMWCNYNSADAFDTDDTSTYFHMHNNVQMGGFLLKSDFGGSEIEFEDSMQIFGTSGSVQFQAIPVSSHNYVHNCTVLFSRSGENLLWWPIGENPCPNASNAIRFADMKIYNPTGDSTVCGQSVQHWQAQGFLPNVSNHVLPSSAATVVDMARGVLGV